PHEFEHTLVSDPCRDARHQAVVIDSIEELFEININYDAVAFSDIALRLGYRLMGRASRPEAVAVLGERWVPTLLQNLQQRLLDQSVDDTRHAGDWGFTPLDRLPSQLLLDALPQSAHEMPVLLATPNRSGLRPSFPARPIRCSAFRLGVPH